MTMNTQQHTDTIEQRILWTAGHLAMKRAMSTASQEPTQEEIWLGEALEALLVLKKELGLTSALSQTEDARQLRIANGMEQ
jgi:hypothetical protein